MLVNLQRGHNIFNNIIAEILNGILFIALTESELFIGWQAEGCAVTQTETGWPAGGNMKRLHDDGDEEQSEWGAEDGTRKHRDDNNDATASKATEAAEDTDNVHLPCELAHISEPPPSHSSSPTSSHMRWPGVFLNRPRRESLSLLSKRALTRILLWMWLDGEDILLGGRAQRFFSPPWDLKSIGSCVLLDTVSTLASCALWESRRHSPAALLKSCWFKM